MLSVLHAQRGRGPHASLLVLVSFLLWRCSIWTRFGHLPHSEYEVRGCTKCDNGLYSWHNASCRAKSGAEASSPDQRARAHGHELAAAAQPGQWVLIEAFNDDVDEMWLAKTVAFSAFGDAVCCKKDTDGQKNIYGTRFNTGDYMVAVQLYDRLCESGNGERREFVRGRCMVDVINSTELRMIVFLDYLHRRFSFS